MTNNNDRKNVKNKYSRRLNNLGDCRRLLAWCTNEVLAGNMHRETASKIGYLVNIIKDIIEKQTLNDIKYEVKFIKNIVEEYREDEFD